MEHILRRHYGQNAMYLVLEDDTILKAHFSSVLRALWKHVPMDWDVVRIGFHGSGHDADKLNRYVYKPKATTAGLYPGLQGYVVAPSTLPRVLRALTEARIAQ